MWKSTLEAVIDRISPQETRLALSKATPDISRGKYIEYISNADKSVKIVAGEANSKLFNRPALKNTLESMLSHNKESTFEIVFHKTNNADDAEKLFQIENKELFALKRKFGERVHIYWSPIRPRQHYAVLDEGKFVILEEPEHRKFAEFWAAVVLNPAQGKKWAARFNEYVDYCKELKFERTHKLAA